MLSSDKTQTTAIVASLVDWWKMAGVDYLVQDSPVDWLEPVEAEAAPPPEAIPTRAKATEPTAALPDITQSDWPTDIAALQNAIMMGHMLPGNQYGGKPAVPVGLASAPLMIIGDLPDIEEIDAGRLGQGAAGRLLGNMVKAIGYDIANCYLSALATTRPATGELPEQDLANLAAFALHQIDLVGPQHILILGSATCRALLGAELMDVRVSKPDINHIVGKKAATPTFHPRTLLARPILKAQAWQDLQMIAKKDAL